MGRVRAAKQGTQNLLARPTHSIGGAKHSFRARHRRGRDHRDGRRALTAQCAQCCGASTRSSSSSCTTTLAALLRALPRLDTDATGLGSRDARTLPVRELPTLLDDRLNKPDRRSLTSPAIRASSSSPMYGRLLSTGTESVSIVAPSVRAVLSAAPGSRIERDGDGDASLRGRRGSISRGRQSTDLWRRARPRLARWVWTRLTVADVS